MRELGLEEKLTERLKGIDLPTFDDMSDGLEVWSSVVGKSYTLGSATTGHHLVDSVTEQQIIRAVNFIIKNRNGNMEAFDDGFGRTVWVAGRFSWTRFWIPAHYHDIEPTYDSPEYDDRGT